MALQKLPISIAEYFTKETLGSLRLDIETFAESRGRALGLRVTAYVYAMPGQRIEIHKRWPADWWQAFRERWVPAWWLRRWPVQYERVDVDIQQYGPICPELWQL